MKIRPQNYKNKIDEYYFIIISVLLFSFFVIVNSFSPLTSDDIYSLYHIQFDNITDALSQVYYFGNGRVIGNLLVFLLVRNTLLRVLFKSVIMYLLFLGLVKLLDVKHKTILLAIAILIIFPSSQMYAQVYVWSAGFSNYLPPIVMFLFTLILIKNSAKHPVINGVLLVVLSVGMQLFCEHTTVFFCFAACSVMVYACFIIKRKKVLSVLYFLSAMAGACIMVSVPILSDSADKSGGYRGVVGNLSELVARVCENLVTFTTMMSSCFLLWMSLSLFTVLYMKDKKIVLWGHNVKRFILYILLVIPVFCLFTSLLVQNLVHPGMEIVYWLLLFGFIIYLSCVVIVFTKNWKDIFNQKINIILLYTMISVLPLLVVYPIRARVFYLPYIGFTIAAVMVMKQAAAEGKMGEQLHRLALTVSAVLSAVFIIIGVDWKYADGLRDTYFYRMMDLDRKEILLPVLPHSQLLQGDGDIAFWQYRVKALQDEEIDIIFTDWEEWLREKEPPEQE